MAVSARFFVSRVAKLATSVQPAGWAAPVPWCEVELYPATRGEENKAWASATPSGSIKMTIGNPAAAKFFEDHLGKDVAITFDEVLAPVEG